MDWYIFPFWGASVSLYIVGIQRVAAMLTDMVDIFAKHFFIMFAKYHFIIEWCLADKILPQIAQIGTDIGRRRIWQKKQNSLHIHTRKYNEFCFMYIWSFDSPSSDKVGVGLLCQMLFIVL